MASLGPVQSLQTEHSATPKIRRDQYKRILNIVRTNAHLPEVALGLVRDYIQSAPDVVAILFNSDQTAIRVCLRNSERLESEYQFALEALEIIETPTL